MLEPALGQAAVGGIVLGQLADHLHVRAGVAQHVHEVVHDGVEGVAHQIVQRFGQFTPGVQVGDLVVAVLHVLAEALQLRAQELVLVGVLAALLILVDPLPRETLVDLAGHHTGEDGIARILRGRGQDAVEQVLFLHTEVLRYQRLQGVPLIQTQVVDQYHEQRCSGFVDVRCDAWP